MPTRPDWGSHVPDPRVDALRGRVGVLRRDDADAGVLWVKVEPYARRVSGRLWWGRWQTFEALRLLTSVDGRLEDNLTHPERLEGELRDLGRGLFRYRGEVLRVAWATADEAERLRRTTFS